MTKLDNFRCERCGSNSTVPIPGGTKLESKYLCKKCGLTFDIGDNHG